jgi:hypothetical protein
VPFAAPPSPRSGRASPPGRAACPPRRPLRALSERGQASAELVAVLPLLALVLAVAWQCLLAGDAFWQARAAAGAAARAQAVGADPRAAARAHLPPRLERGLRVRGESGGDVRVSIRIPAVVEALSLGRVAATAHFDPQDT